MTKRDLFLIVIKLFGLYLAAQTTFQLFPSFIPYFMGQESFQSRDFLSIATVLAFILLFVGAFLLLIFSGKYLVKWLKLDQDFDSPTIDGNIFTEATIIKLASLIVGGFLVIHSLEALLRYSLYVFYLERWEGNMEVMDKFQLFSSLVQVMIGSFLITKYRSIQRLLLKDKE